MADKYKTISTSASSAKVEDRILSQSIQTRKIVRPEIVNNPNNNEASVKITILHQKAVKKNEFEDIAEESLTKLKAREIVKLFLDTRETKALYDELQNLYAIHQAAGVPRGETTLIVGHEEEIVLTDPRRANLIKELIKRDYSEEVWNQLIDVDPDLATRLSQARLHQYRTKILKTFANMLEHDHAENEWQDFFEQNTWIFGYGLRYQILRTITSQPHYGGQTVDGKGINKGDFLQSTLGHTGFTVLVEIKKSSTPLLQVKQYRNDSFVPSEDLSGGVAQLRSNARNWEIEGSRSEKNAAELNQEYIFTVKPKTILVIGNTNQIKTSIDKRNSFELFRRGQNDVEILTFDELFERAKFIVEHEDKNSPSDNPVDI